jgi:hypothetical protein
MSGEPIARVRFLRRWNNLNTNDVAVFPLGMAQSLVANRYAEAMAPPESAVATEAVSPTPANVPQRGPTQTVRK